MRTEVVPHRDDALDVGCRPYRGYEGIRGVFLDSVGKYPNAVALVIGNEQWTYSELDGIARRWAGLLRDVPGGSPARVGIYAYRSLTAYVGILAALYAGATFVPLNRKFPDDRTRYMIERAGLDALIVDKASASQCATIVATMPGAPVILRPDSAVSGDRMFGHHDCESARPLRDLREMHPDEHAYLLFTSGSTGQPKGVPVSHGNVRAFLDYNAERYEFGPQDRFSQTFDLTFDLSVFDLFVAWHAGGAVCVQQPIELLAPFKSIERNQITVWFSVPSVASHLVRNNLLMPGSMPGLRWSLFCGEALPRSIAEAWQAAAPNSVVENLYGPTELTIACAAYRWNPERSLSECARDLVPIGQLYPHMRPLLIDPETLADTTQGEVGELCVAGPQRFSGYWRSKELDVGRFVERVEAGEVVRYYRTGDLVRFGESGNLEFVGRTDHQVKIGGYRVELGEIEAVLRVAGCIDAVALVCVPVGGTEPTVCVVVSGSPVDNEQLFCQLRAALPAYMVPAAIYRVESMPLNQNDKVDRSALRSAVERGGIPSP